MCSVYGAVKVSQKYFAIKLMALFLFVIVLAELFKEADAFSEFSYFYFFLMLSCLPLVLGQEAGRLRLAGSERSSSTFWRGIGKWREYKRVSGIPLQHIGRSPGNRIQHFVLLFNWMLASGHHSDYDART
jgi:hypothetical protein